MYYSKRNPTMGLGVVECIWELRIEEHEQGVYCVPDNHGDLLVNVGDALEVSILTTARTHTIKHGQLVQFNCHSRGTYLHSNGVVHAISAKINPGWIRQIGVISPLRDSYTVIDNNCNIKSDEKLDRYIQEVLWNAVLPDPVLVRAIDIIFENKGELWLKDLYDQLEVSKSTLEQKFLRELGITPKEVCKIEKMKRFFDNYNRYRDLYNLTQLTMMSGYFDQSHFIKDFRYFMDMTPGKFLKQCEEQFETLMAPNYA